MLVALIFIRWFREGWGVRWDLWYAIEVWCEVGKWPDCGILLTAKGQQKEDKEGESSVYSTVSQISIEHHYWLTHCKKSHLVSAAPESYINQARKHRLAGSSRHVIYSLHPTYWEWLCLQEAMFIGCNESEIKKNRTTHTHTQKTETEKKGQSE